MCSNDSSSEACWIGPDGPFFNNSSSSTIDGSKNPTVDLPIDMTFNDGHMLSIATYSVLLVISVCGNITVLVNLIRRRHISNPRVNIMLTHLAIADLLVSLASLVFFYRLTKDVWFCATQLLARMMGGLIWIALPVIGCRVAIVKTKRVLRCTSPVDWRLSEKLTCLFAKMTYKIRWRCEWRF